MTSDRPYLVRDYIPQFDDGRSLSEQQRTKFGTDAELVGSD